MSVQSQGAAGEVAAAPNPRCTIEIGAMVAKGVENKNVDTSVTAK